MESKKVPILAGPEFRELWEERLTRKAKKAVRYAVARGEALEDPGLASVAVSLSRKYQRSLKNWWRGYALACALWVGLFIVLMSTPGNGFVTMSRITAGLWVIALPTKVVIFLLFQRPRYRESERRNLQRLRHPA
jgi:hypothetical protein